LLNAAPAHCKGLLDVGAGGWQVALVVEDKAEL